MVAVFLDAAGRNLRFASIGRELSYFADVARYNISVLIDLTALRAMLSVTAPPFRVFPPLATSDAATNTFLLEPFVPEASMSADFFQLWDRD